MKKDFKIIVPKKKELYIFLALYFGETLLKKDFKIIVPKKKELYFFFGIIFGETLLKKDFKIKLLSLKKVLLSWENGHGRLGKLVKFQHELDMMS